MKTLPLSIITFLLIMLLFPFDTILAQNESQPTIYFDQASYATKGMRCNSDYIGNIFTPGPEQTKTTIIVTDPSANKYSTAIDRVSVRVWSDSDNNGIEITAYETEVNSGIFKGIIMISDGPSTQDTIHVNDGDTISARYSGATPWSPNTTDHGTTTNHGITATAFIGMSCPPLERVPASGIQITDNKGNETRTIVVNKQIQIKSNISNITIRNQTFAYIVQINDKNGNSQSLSWVSGTLPPSQKFSPGVSWTPYKAGNYNVQVFVWQSINNPNALSPPLSIDFTVWPSLSAYTGYKTMVAENPRCQLGYELVIKSSNNSHVCVTPDTAQKLIKHEWAKTLENSSLPTINETKKESYITKQDATYLGQTVDEWKSMTPEQLRVYYEKYKDKFYIDLGKFLIKDAMQKELERQKIVNLHDDFDVFPGMILDSLPPHISYDAVVNATDGNSYLLLGGVFANKIESTKITKLTFDRDILASLNSDKNLPFANLVVETRSVTISRLTNSDIPWSSIGTGKGMVLEIGLYTSVYHMIPDAQKYYTARAKQLVPFYVPVLVEVPRFGTGEAK